MKQLAWVAVLGLTIGGSVVKGQESHSGRFFAEPGTKGDTTLILYGSAGGPEKGAPQNQSDGAVYLYWRLAGEEKPAPESTEMIPVYQKLTRHVKCTRTVQRSGLIDRQDLTLNHYRCEFTIGGNGLVSPPLE